MNYGQIICAKCNKPCDFEESGLHKAPIGSPFRLMHGDDRKMLRNQGDGRPFSETGYRIIRARCHGETADIFMTNEDHDAAMKSRKPIMVFEATPAIEENDALRISEDAQFPMPVKVLRDKVIDV